MHPKLPSLPEDLLTVLKFLALAVGIPTVMILVGSAMSGH